MRRLWNALACGVDADERLVHPYAECMADPNTTLHRVIVSGAVRRLLLSAEAVEERLPIQLERGEITMAEIRSGRARYCE